MTQLEAGIIVEHEHKPTYDWFTKYALDNEEFPSPEELYKHIAQDHLRDHPGVYYSKLDKAGLAEELHK